MTIKQLSVFVENKTGRINDVTRILGANGINMTAFCLAESVEFGILRMVVSDPEKAVRVLKEERFAVNVTEVVCLSCPNTPGAMSKVLDYLAAEDVFIEYMYAFSQGDMANVVIRPTDTVRWAEILQRWQCTLMGTNNLCQL